MNLRTSILVLAFVQIFSTIAASQERPLDWKFSAEGVPLVDDKKTGLTFYGLEQGAQAAFKSVDDVKGAVVVLPGPRMDEQERKKAIAGGIDPDRMLTAMAVALVLPMTADASDFFISKEDWKGLYVYRWKLKNGAEACASSLPLKPYSDEHDVLYVWSCSFKPDDGVLIVTRNGEKSIKGYEDYIPRTFRQIIQEHSDPKILSKNNGSMILTGDTFSSRVKAVYTGQSRKISPEKKQHLDLLVTSFNVDQKIINQYGTEFLFLEGTAEHWLPVQARLIPIFDKELKKGEPITLYAEWVGAKKISGKWEWIFMVHEFQKR